MTSSSGGESLRDVPARRFVPALEGLRGLAALTIVGYHCWVRGGAPAIDGGPLRNAVSCGFLAVSCFFVLSAFVLFLPAARADAAPRAFAFYRRRVARLAPACWTVLAACVVLIPLLTAQADRARDTVTPAGVAAHALFLQNLARLWPSYDSALGFRVDPVVYTLTAEALFSLALPLAAVVVLRAPRALAAAVLAGIAARYALAHAGGISSATRAELLSLVPPLLVDFPLGMAAALAYARGVRVPRPGLVAGAAFAVVLLCVALAGGAQPGPAKRDVEADALVMTIVAAAFATIVLALASAADGLLASRPLRAAGRWSYMVYLVHFPLIGFALVTLDVPADPLELALVAFPGALLLGAFGHRFVEQPARRLIAGRSAAPRAPTAAAG